MCLDKAKAKFSLETNFWNYLVKLNLFFHYSNWVAKEVHEILLKFVFSKKATKFEKIFTVDLTLTTYCQIDGEDFANFCGLLRKHELYHMDLMDLLSKLIWALEWQIYNEIW